VGVEPWSRAYAEKVSPGNNLNFALLGTRGGRVPPPVILSLLTKVAQCVQRPPPRVFNRSELFLIM
jgi:hypothetical protein